MIRPSPTAWCCFALVVLSATGRGAALSGDRVAYGVEINGVFYTVEAGFVAGRETRLFSDGARTFTEEELRAHVAAQTPVKLTSALAERLALAAENERLELTVVLVNQPAGPISRSVWGQRAAERRALTRQIQAISRSALPVGVFSPEQERATSAAPLAPSAVAARKVLSAQLDELDRVARIEIAERLAAAISPDQDALSDFVVLLGGRETARVSVMNILGVELAAGQVATLAAHPLVARIDLNHPGEPELDNHKVSLGLTTGFWPGGFTGGVHDVGVLDTGVKETHPALSSHPFLSNFGGGDTDGHGTGMAGILCSTDPIYSGMAKACDKIVAAIAGDINTSMPGMAYIASTGEPENVNYSFGNGTANVNDYSPTDQFFDGVIDTFGYMVSKSTGNGGFSSGPPTITHPAPAFNLLASANMDDFNTIPRSDDRITSSSSTGPTVAGRKKPDITAPGNNSMSCNLSNGFSNIGGTSSASPHTGGAIVLLYEMGNTDVMAGKAVLLNTTDAIDSKNTSTVADDQFVAGSWWDRRYGWGYLNLGAAYLHGLNVFVDQVPDEPETADFRLFVGPMFKDERATLVWQRHVAYNGSTFPTQVELLSNLDLTAWREADGGSLGGSTSAIDNVEQLDVDEDELVVLKVEAFGTFDPDITTESFALATQESFAAATGPTFAADFSVPSSVPPSTQFQLTVEVSNAGDVAAHAVAVTLSGVQVVSGPNPAPLGSIAAGGKAQAIWTVAAAATPGTYPLDTAISSASYGETFAGTGQGSYKVEGGCTGDINGDGKTCQEDLGILLAAYGDCEGDPGYNPAANLATGGASAKCIDQADLGVLLAAYGCGGCP